MGFVEAVLLAVIAASTPLLLAASGELMVERAGVLNLGVEGMMIVGAACGFAGAYHTGSIAVGALCGILGGMALSAVFAALTLGLAANQVASGLALTILGVGLSGLIGSGYVGQKIDGAAHLYIPVHHRHSADRPRDLRRERLRLLLGRPDHRHLVLPLSHQAGAGAARGRRQPRLGPCAWLSGAENPRSLPCCSAAPARDWAAPICRSPIRPSGYRG